MSGRRLKYWLSKWAIANLANRSARTCWADLVSYAMHERTGNPDDDEHYSLRASVSGGGRCREESKTHRDLSCYCGKFVNGCRSR